MKIGIVTVGDASNYGSFLQAYALMVVLEEWGHEVVFLNSRDEKFVRKLYYDWTPRKRYLKCPVRFVKKNISGKKRYEIFIDEHKIFTHCNRNELDRFDMILLGSDEIWNVQNEEFRRSIFYGDIAKPTVAFAVSAGNATYQDFLKYPKYIEQIRRIKDIYVRDENTHQLVKQITKKNVEVVCDPTFLIDREKCAQEYKDEYLKKNKYILIYVYTGSLPRITIKAIKSFAKRQKMKLVSVGLFNEWCDYNVICRPREFGTIIQGAAYVITATFHGSVFSIIYEKQFVSIGTKMKIKDLLKTLDLQERCVEREKISENVLENLLADEMIDYNSVKVIQNEMRKDSLEKLREVIEKYDRRSM